MSKGDSLLYLQHMLVYAEEAITFVQGKSRADLDAERILNLALVRLIEMIGEAANRVPPNERANCPDLPWAQIIGMRNRLIHGYDFVDYDILWQTVVEDLPGLVVALKRIAP